MAYWYARDAARANAAAAAAAEAARAAQPAVDDSAPPTPPPSVLKHEAATPAPPGDATPMAGGVGASTLAQANKPADAALVGALALLFNAAVFSLFAIIK